MPWKIAGLVIGVLLGIIALLYVRRPFFLSFPIQMGLLLAGGEIGERMGSSRQE